MRMRSQESVEFLVYIAVAAASLAVSLSLFVPYYSGMRRQSEASGFGDFVASLNYATGYSRYAFTARVPEGICNATLSNGSISGPYGSFQLYGNVTFSPAVCGEGGSVALVTVERTGQGYVVG